MNVKEDVGEKAHLSSTKTSTFTGLGINSYALRNTHIRILVTDRVTIDKKSKELADLEAEIVCLNNYVCLLSLALSACVWGGVVCLYACAFVCEY